MLCSFHSVPTKPWIPPPVFHGKPQVGKNLWQKPVIISSRTYINNPKEYPNSIGGVWVRHWCQQLKEKKHFKFKVRPSWFVFFPILRDGKTKWTHPIHLENFRWESSKVIRIPHCFPSSHRLLQSLAGIREAWASWTKSSGSQAAGWDYGFQGLRKVAVVSFFNFWH